MKLCFTCWCSWNSVLFHEIFSNFFFSGSGWGSWFYFGFQYQTSISYIEDTQQILFGSANSFESYCVHMKSPRTYVQTDRQADGRDFFCLYCLVRHTKHEHSSKGENFFFTHAITILSLFTYSVCDEKVIYNRVKLHRNYMDNLQNSRMALFIKLGRTLESMIVIIFTFSSHTEYVKRKGIVIAWVKKKFSPFDKCSWFVCLRRQHKPKKNSVCPSVCLSGCLDVRTYVDFSCAHNNFWRS